MVNSYNGMGGIVLPNWNTGYGTAIPQTQPQPQVNTNKVYVTDGNDAMTRMAPYNSIILYVQQDETMIHEVYTDGQGRKQIRSRALTEPAQAQEQPREDVVSRKEFDELKAIVDELRGGNVNANAR